MVALAAVYMFLVTILLMFSVFPVKGWSISKYWSIAVWFVAVYWYSWLANWLGQNNESFIEEVISLFFILALLFPIIFFAYKRADILGEPLRKILNKAKG